MQSELTIAPTDFAVYQERCYGYSLEEVAERLHISVEAVQEATERYCLSRGITTSRSVHERKSMALARLDLATKSLMPKLVTGDYMAIHAYLKIQEREAKLTGMESATRQDTHITIDIPWLTKERLAYKDDSGEVIDNVTDISPILEVKKVAEAAWKEPVRAKPFDLTPRDGDE